MWNEDSAGNVILFDVSNIMYSNKINIPIAANLIDNATYVQAIPLMISEAPECL